MYYKTQYNSPIGQITLASDGENLAGLWFDAQKHFGGKIIDKLIENDDIKIFHYTKLWLNDYFKGAKPQTSAIPLAPAGTLFQKKIWRILCKIPYGEVLTYKDIAQEFASQNRLKTMSSRAIGAAIGHNPISIIIPCHRVIASNGKLKGYAGGIEKKLALLKLENPNITFN